MTEKQTIIHLYRVDNFSIRKISRTVNRSRNTIRRIIREYLLALKSPSGSEDFEDFEKNAVSNFEEIEKNFK